MRLENQFRRYSTLSDIYKPKHYKQGDIEAIDIMEQVAGSYKSKTRAINMSHALKYLIRAPFKGNEEGDIDKAIDYRMRVKYCEWKNWKGVVEGEQRQNEEKV